MSAATVRQVSMIAGSPGRVGSVIATLSRLAIWPASRRYAVESDRRLQSERARMSRRLATYVVTALLVVGCALPVKPVPTQPPTPEHALAVINGDLASEAEFSRLLDEIQAGSEFCRAEPDRMHVADVLVTSYDQGGKSGTLLEWARAIASVC